VRPSALLLVTAALGGLLALQAARAQAPQDKQPSPAAQEPRQPATEPSASEEAAGTFSEHLEVAAVSVPVRILLPKGAPPLAPEELIVVEGGVTWPVLALEPIARSTAQQAPAGSAPTPASSAASRAWRIVLYFDLQLAGVSSVRQAAWELGGEADELVALGEVEIVVVDDGIERVLAPTRDADEVKRALRKKVADEFGQRRLVRLRREFYEQSNRGIGLSRRRGQSATGGSEGSLATMFAGEEARMLERRRRLAEAYFAERSVPDWPQAAFLVTGGYDLSPGEFYLPLVEGGEVGSQETSRLVSDLNRLQQGQATEGLARGLAALGWVVNPVLPYDQDNSFVSDVSTTGGERWRALRSGRGEGSSQPLTVIQHPLDPWRMVSGATGGELVVDVRKLDETLERLGEKEMLTYQVSRRRDGALLPLEVRSTRPGVEIEAPSWVSAGTPEALAGARARALLDGDGESGDLPVRVIVTTSPSETKGQETGHIEATVELGPLGEARSLLTATSIRFTVAVPKPDGGVLVLHERAERIDLSNRRGWIFEARIVAPAGTPQVAVVAEELATGAWGGAVGKWGR